MKKLVSLTACLAIAFQMFAAGKPHFVPASRNDDIANAVLLKGTNVTEIGTVFGATLEDKEPLPYFNSAHSVWWKWVAPEDGRYSFITTSDDMNPLMAIYREIPEDTLIAPSMNGNRYSQLNVPLVAGELIYIAVDGTAQSRRERFTLNVRKVSPPPNDSFANRLPLLNTLAIGSDEGATTEPGEPHEDDYRTSTVWWHFTPATSGWYTIQARLAITNSVPTEIHFENVSLYTGDALTNLQEVPERYRIFEDAYDYPMFLLTAGTNYAVEVWDYRNRFGEIRLSARHHPRPTNDDFVNATRIPSEGVYVVEGTTYGATPEAGDPVLGFFYTSVWWRWTAPSSTYYAVEWNEEIGGAPVILTGSTLEELMFVPLQGLERSRFFFEATSGEEYYLLGAGDLPGYPFWFRLSPVSERGGF